MLKFREPVARTRFVAEPKPVLLGSFGETGELVIKRFQSQFLFFVKNSDQESVGTKWDCGDAGRELRGLVIGNHSESMTAFAAELRILSNLSSTFLTGPSETHSFHLLNFRAESLLEDDYVGHV